MGVWVLCAALLTAAASPTAGRTVPTTSQQPGDSQRAAYVLQATELYNSEDDGEVVYRALGVPPEVESHDSENVTFIIKETACLKSGEKDEKCSFKEDGIVKNCTASPPGPDGRRLEVTCRNVDTAGEGDKKPEAPRNHRVYKPLTRKQKGINFLQFDDKNTKIGHAANSCIFCILDWLSTNTNGR